MKHRIHTCLSFEHQDEEVVRFRTSGFTASRIKRGLHHAGGGPLPEWAVLRVSFESNEQTRSALDGGKGFSLPPAALLVVSCGDQAEADRYWQASSAVPGAERCGWLENRYGASWQTVPEALMDMLKQRGAERRAKATAALRQAFGQS